jgi:protein O-mannosyl-transferase
VSPWLSDRRDRLAIAAVVALAILTHGSALTGGYIWLDHTHLEEGLALAPPGEWPSLFGRGFAGTGFYRPLVALSLSIDALVSKTPLWFRLVTVAWHAAAAVTTLLCGRALGLSRRGALIAAGLFAVHPATSLVANAIAFRSEAMITVALLVLVVAHLRGKPLLAGAALLFGALTKETAWILGPLLLATLELLRRFDRSGRLGGEPASMRLLIAEGTALTSATALHSSFAPSWRASFHTLSIDEAVGTRLAAFGKSVRLMLVPVDPTICDAFRVTGVAHWSALFGAIAGVILAALVWRRRGPAWLLAVALLPSLHLVPLMRWWSPHYLYLPLAFGALWVGDRLDALGKTGARIAGVVGLCFAALSLQEGFRYRSDAALWGPEVERQPECREGQFFLGDAARVAGAWDVAAHRYERAAAETPGYVAYVDQAAALQNVGAMRLAQDRLPEARTAWNAALQISKDPRQKRRLVCNLAALALRSGNPEEALALLEPELARPDPLPEAIQLSARALHAVGRSGDAAELLRGTPLPAPE